MNLNIDCRQLSEGKYEFSTTLFHQQHAIVVEADTEELAEQFGREQLTRSVMHSLAVNYLQEPYVFTAYNHEIQGMQTLTISATFS